MTHDEWVSILLPRQLRRQPGNVSTLHHFTNTQSFHSKIVQSCTGFMLYRTFWVWDDSLSSDGKTLVTPVLHIFKYDKNRPHVVFLIFTLEEKRSTS